MRLLSVVAKFAVLVDVETFLLYTFINAQTVEIFYSVEQNHTANGCPEVDDEDAEALSAEKSPAVSVECTVGSAEQAGHQCAEDATAPCRRQGR